MASKRAQVTPLRPELGAPESLLEHLTERQLASLNGLQSVLSAIENRLASMSRLGGMTERPRVGIFVDVPNIVYAAERLKISIDFGKLMEFLSRDRELVRASAYAPINDDPDAELETQRFVKPFVGLGYRIVTKQLKRYSDGSTKANFDVELAIDVLTMSDRLDIVVLVSGDGDFRRLVELVASKGVRVEVVAFGASTAAELRAVADEYIDINDHIAELRVK
ncbi:MAG: NYN domain-containing protein [Chloroflexi bacterium]|nr:NYN domain-containing protein [Chloroflexota bacterium]